VEGCFRQAGAERRKETCRFRLKSRAEALLDILAKNPLQTAPPYEKLVGDLAGAYSRRINIQHRLVYQFYRKERAVKVLRMSTRYE
jgi:toxin YoeB